MDFDSLREVRSGATAAVIVMYKEALGWRTDIIEAIQRLSLRYARKLRPVHTLPRGHRVDVPGDEPVGDRRGRHFRN